MMEHLDREGLECPLYPDLSVDDLLEKICENQGKSVGSADLTKRERDYDTAIDLAAEAIEKMVTDSKTKMATPSGII